MSIFESDGKYMFLVTFGICFHILRGKCSPILATVLHWLPIVFALRQNQKKKLLIHQDIFVRIINIL